MSFRGPPTPDRPFAPRVAGLRNPAAACWRSDAAARTAAAATTWPDGAYRPRHGTAGNRAFHPPAPAQSRYTTPPRPDERINPLLGKRQAPSRLADARRTGLHLLVIPEPRTIRWPRERVNSPQPLRKASQTARGFTSTPGTYVRSTPVGEGRHRVVPAANSFAWTVPAGASELAARRNHCGKPRKPRETSTAHRNIRTEHTRRRRPTSRCPSREFIRLDRACGSE
jgi:hypothetical protein